MISPAIIMAMLSGRALKTYKNADTNTLNHKYKYKQMYANTAGQNDRLSHHCAVLLCEKYK